MNFGLFKSRLASAQTEEEIDNIMEPLAKQLDHDNKEDVNHFMELGRYAIVRFLELGIPLDEDLQEAASSFVLADLLGISNTSN